jgi:hypothetical protein
MTDIGIVREQLSTLAQGYVTIEVPPRPAADLSTPEALARAADEVPYIEPERRSTGRSVASLYSEVLGATIVASASEAPPEVAAAQRLLFADESGRVPTRLYNMYINYKTALDAARASGRTGEIEWRKLQTAQPGRVEEALAILAQHRERGLDAAFATAREAFAAGQRDGLYGRYHACNATPRNFWATQGAQDMGSAEPRSPVRVMLERPWLRFALLSREGWRVPGREAGAYSNGRADASNTGLLALVPVALFIGWEQDGTPVIVAWDNLVVPPCPPRT